MAEKKQQSILDKKTLAIILYFIEKLNGALGKTHLQKMLFLTDLIYSKKFKKQLTALDYKKYTYGPYAEAVNDYTDLLVSKNLIEQRSFPFSSDPEKKYTRFYSSSKTSVKKLLAHLINDEEFVLLEEIIDSYGNMSLHDVLDIVYQLELVKTSEKNTPLDFAQKKLENKEEEIEGEIDIFA